MSRSSSQAADVLPQRVAVDRLVSAYWQCPTGGTDPLLRACVRIQRAVHRLLESACDGAPLAAPDPRVFAAAHLLVSRHGRRVALGRALGAVAVGTPADLTLRWLHQFIEVVDELLVQGPWAGREPSEIIEFVTPGVVDSFGRAMTKILEPLGPALTAAVHGSCADGSAVPFSDFDDIIILRRSSWSDLDTFADVTARLGDAARAFQVRDPLQHHGHWIYSDVDLVALDDALLPKQVLREALLLHGGPAIEMRRRSEPLTTAAILWSQARRVATAAPSAARGDINVYQLKHLVSSISLIPALLAQCAGAELSKRDALSRVFDDLPASVHEGIVWASSVRLGWSGVVDDEWLDAVRALNRDSPLPRSLMEAGADKGAPGAVLEGELALGTSGLRSLVLLADMCAAVIRQRFGLRP